MKFNSIALAVFAASTATVATAGVTVTPLVGYHAIELDDTHDKQREILRTGKNLYKTLEGKDITPIPSSNTDNGGVAKESSLYTGLALGVELTPATQLQVEYGVAEANGEASERSAAAGINRFDVKQQMLSANALIGLDQFTGNTSAKFKPYALVGVGQSKISVKNRQAYGANAPVAGYAVNQTVPAGTEVSESKDTIGNLGLGARYLVNDVLAVRGEARAIHNFDNNWWEGLATAGLEVTLGGRLGAVAPVVVPEPAKPVMPTVMPKPVIIEDAPVLDSDGDGVADHLDACPNTPRNEVVDERGCTKQVDVVDELRMELRVFFDRDKSNIKPQFRDEVAKVATAMKEFPNATAVIEGHASKDSKRSNAKYNQRLSEARANAVKTMLSSQYGVAPNRLNAVGYGFDRPIAPNDTDEGRAMNRRVYAVIQGNKVTTVNQTKDMVIR